MKKPIIGITMGDPASIGPEISVMALTDPKVLERCDPLIVGDAAVMEDAVKVVCPGRVQIRAVQKVKEAVFEPGVINVLDLGLVDMDKLAYGQASAMCGEAAFRYVEKVIQLAMDGEIDATVTNALNKAAINMAGHHFAGHTEIYAHYTNTKNYTMMLAHENLRVVHISTHVSLREACDRVKKDRVLSVIRIANDACKALGMDTMPVIVRKLTDEEAVITMVDSNLQREHILPSEKAFAYKMKMEALDRKAGRPKNWDQVGPNFKGMRSAEIVGEKTGDSATQVKRYIRLTNLIPEILQMVDDGKIALTPAVEMSYLQPSEQEMLFSVMDCDEVTPSLSQAQRLRRMSEEQRFTDSAVMQLMSEVKGNQVEYVKVPVDKLRSYFRPDTSMKQMTETLVKAMEFYNRHLERQRRDRDAR